MAVDEEASLWPTYDLILNEPRTHYRTSVKSIHWQLRSLIGVENQDIIYYPAGPTNTFIQRLNIKTRRSETIKVITFEPRCLVARNGWVCCGGESGEFAVIQDASRADGAGRDSDRNFRNTLDALDSATATGADASMSRLGRDMLNILERINGYDTEWKSSSHKFGSERVNCITLWFPPKSLTPATGSYGIPVAVLANNDKTVAVVSLNDPEELDEIEYPDFVNRAVISPDGSMLAAVSDDPYLYVHMRQRRLGRLGEGHEWVLRRKIQLKSQRRDDKSDNRGSFAATFSPSGRYLAIGTQYGTISVFEVEALKDPESESLITYFQSSRPQTEMGAVRDMAFSPGPFDLLAWTEDRGRVGIADARSRFTKRQIIALDAHQDYSHTDIADRNVIDPRLLDGRSSRSNMDWLSSDQPTSDPQPQQPPPQPSQQLRSRLANPNNAATEGIGLERFHSTPLSREETAVLEALQDVTRRREQREQLQQREQRDQHTQQRGWRYSAWAERVSDSSRPRPQVIDVPNEPELLSRMLSQLRTEMRQQREQLRGILQQERARDPSAVTWRAAGSQTRSSGQTDSDLQSRGQRVSEETRSVSQDRRAPLPGRTRNVIQALTSNMDYISQLQNVLGPNPGEGSEGRTRADDSTNNVSQNFAAPTRQSPWNNSSQTNGWSDLDALYNISTGGAATESARGENSRARRVLADVWAEDAPGFSRRYYSRFGASVRDHQEPDHTAGLAWSDNGQILYVGAVDGIYEFHINRHSRKVFPSIELC